jgi:hypothetical protein
MSVFVLRSVPSALWTRLTHALTRRGMNRQQAIEQAIDEWCTRVEASEQGGDTVASVRVSGQVSSV